MSSSYVPAARLPITEKDVCCGSITVSVQGSCNLPGCGVRYRGGFCLY